MRASSFRLVGSPYQQVSIGSVAQEVFNTGYVEGDGGVMYVGASLTAGYGMQYRENFLHHSLEVPGLHGRGGICAFLSSLLVRAFELRKCGRSWEELWAWQISTIIWVA